MANPFKYSNYIEKNEGLVPKKLINRNVTKPTPIFDNELIDIYKPKAEGEES